MFHSYPSNRGQKRRGGSLLLYYLSLSLSLSISLTHLSRWLHRRWFFSKPFSDPFQELSASRVWPQPIPIATHHSYPSNLFLSPPLLLLSIPPIPSSCPFTSPYTVAVQALMSCKNILIEKGKFRQAADREKSIAELLKNDCHDQQKALDSYQQAGNWYLQEGAVAWVHGVADSIECRERNRWGSTIGSRLEDRSGMTALWDMDDKLMRENE